MERVSSGKELVIINHFSNGRRQSEYIVALKRGASEKAFFLLTA